MPLVSQPIVHFDNYVCTGLEGQKYRTVTIVRITLFTNRLKQIPSHTVSVGGGVMMRNYEWTTFSTFPAVLVMWPEMPQDQVYMLVTGGRLGWGLDQCHPIHGGSKKAQEGKEWCFGMVFGPVGTCVY